ncbi:helix-turn-helix domain-containing protein [Nocardia sp. NPDC059177]|uniref:helix-turn-helix domain-containing protein n=1 Tax=Nocardia sp. NPDC059177 TaxID=3346759 RepID=UPI0036CE6DE8
MEPGAQLRAARAAAGVGLREIARLTHYSPAYLSLIESGKRPVPAEVAVAYTAALGETADGERAGQEWTRRIAASDVGGDTLDRLEAAVDDLASAYSTTPPAELLVGIRQHLGYTARLLNGKMTLVQHRRLLVTAGWLSLLAGTCHIDLDELPAAAARLRAARDIAEESEHPEISAWTLETRAWQHLINREFGEAAELSQAARDIAPADSSVYIQATAQQGRALARKGDSAGTYGALRSVARLVSGLRTPDRPEHHFRYDPSKADTYVATTLSWLGDPAAEVYARHVVADLERAACVRPRRIAMANLDLGLALVAADKPDEAANVALGVVTGGRLVPSHYWRVSEIVTGIEQRDIQSATTVREAFHDTYPG